MEIQSGTEFGVTLGTPIGMMVRNQDQRPKDYGGSTMDLYPRPSHADLTYLEKYGVKASSGGGRSSARETIGGCFLYFLNIVSWESGLIQSIYRPCRCRCHCGEVSAALAQRRDCVVCVVSG